MEEDARYAAMHGKVILEVVIEVYCSQKPTNNKQ